MAVTGKTIPKSTEYVTISEISPGILMLNDGSEDGKVDYGLVGRCRVASATNNYAIVGYDYVGQCRSW